MTGIMRPALTSRILEGSAKVALRPPAAKASLCHKQVS
jgi:hypothetical protein